MLSAWLSNWSSLRIADLHLFEHRSGAWEFDLPIVLERIEEDTIIWTVSQTLLSLNTDEVCIIVPVAILYKFDLHLHIRLCNGTQRHRALLICWRWDIGFEFFIRASHHRIWGKNQKWVRKWGDLGLSLQAASLGASLTQCSLMISYLS